VRSEQNDIQWLRRELQGSAYLSLLSRVQRKQASFTEFRAWEDAVRFVQANGTSSPRVDDLLRAVFLCRDEDRDPRWRSVILGLLWFRLESIARWKRRWDDPEQLWATTLHVFIRVIDRIDVNRRPERLAQKVTNDTLHDLYLECRKRWDRADREVGMDPDELEEIGGGTPAVDYDEVIDLRAARDREIQRLREHLEAGRITESDFLLMVGTRLNGEGLRERAQEMGLSYPVARKRRWRAEAAIRRFEESTR
jgi:hypothetical protein